MSLRVVLLTSLGVLAVALLAGAHVGAAQTVPTQPPSQAAGISVVGQGIVLAQPSTAHITVGVEVSDPSLANAQSQAAQRMDAVVAKLKAEGIADSDIRTVNYSISPQYDNAPNQNPTLRGYLVQNLVDVKTTNIQGLGSLVDGAVSAGATRIYGINFQATDEMEALKAQARDQAVQNARARAEQLARDSGVGLGKVLLVEESDASGVTPVRQAAPAGAAANVAVSTPIQPGELQVSTTVHVVYAIQ